MRRILAEASQVENRESAFNNFWAEPGTEKRNYEAEIHRLKGELLLKQKDSNAAEAQSFFERAIDIARRQNAKWLDGIASPTDGSVPLPVRRSHPPIANAGLSEDARRMVARCAIGPSSA